MSTPPSPWVKDVGEIDFEREVVQASSRQPVVVDFWAPWCGPCRTLGPLLERLIEQRQGQVLLAKVNIDDHPPLAELFGVQAVPTVLGFRDGQPVRMFQGLLPEADLNRFLDEIGPSPADSLVTQARSLEADRPEEAAGLYRQALEQDTRHDAARVGLARVLLALDRLDEVEDVLAPLGSEGELGAEAERLGGVLALRRLVRDLGGAEAVRQRHAAASDSPQALYEQGCVLAVQGDYPQALDKLLAAGERDAGLAASKVRAAMVQVFYALGEQHPLANTYRARLSRLLY